MEIITILIIATIPMVGIALLFWIIRLCQVLTTSLTARDEDISRLTRERDSHAREITDLNQKIASLEAENIANQETTTNHLNQWNETITEIRKEIENIPFIYIRAQWPFPDASPQRIEELKAIARNNYRQYLETPEWRKRANFMKAHVEGKCQACNTPDNTEKPLEVHHRHYGSIGHERPIDLTVLCRECHQLIHEHREIPWPWN